MIENGYAKFGRKKESDLGKMGIDSTIKRERIDRRIDDSDDGNTISSNFQYSATVIHGGFS